MPHSETLGVVVDRHISLSFTDETPPYSGGWGIAKGFVRESSEAAEHEHGEQTFISSGEMSLGLCIHLC